MLCASHVPLQSECNNVSVSRTPGHACHVAICNLISVYCAAMTLLRKYVDINQADVEVLARLSAVLLLGCLWCTHHCVRRDISRDSSLRLASRRKVPGGY